jgi:hypothetical protein
MSATDPETKAATTTEKPTAAESNNNVDNHKESNNKNNSTSTNSSGGGGLWGWGHRLMKWRSGGEDDSSAAQDGNGDDHHLGNTTMTKKTEEGCDESAPHAAEGKSVKVSSDCGEVEAPLTTSGVPVSASSARPMNIWLRRALERQAESAIAAAIRDGKPIPATVMPVVAAEAKSTQPAPAKEAQQSDNPTTITTATAAEPAAAAIAKVSFADLMRQHREGLLAPIAQPPVKATKVVKKPKTSAGHKVESPSMRATTPTAKKPSEGMAPAVEMEVEKRPRVEKEGVSATPPSSATATTTAAAPISTTATAAEKKENTAAVHQGAVRKRAKAAGTSGLKSASAKLTQETSAATSAAATPTHTITVKGKSSLEELRARRNRTTAATGGSAANTPSPHTHGDNGTDAAAENGKDGYNEGALDAISQLLLRYCLGDQSSPTTAKACASGDSAATTKETDTANTSGELAFFNQLMELCETNSLTPESLELLRELFQHVRVLPRPVTATTAPTTAASCSTASTAGATAAVEGDDTAESGPSGTAAGPAKEDDRDAEAYREASRRREYVQQVIMVLINRLKQLKLNEQQRRQKQEKAVAAALAPAAPPQPVIGKAAPSIKVGGVPLNPLPTATASTAPQSGAIPQQQQQQQQQTFTQPNALSYDEQMRRLAEWRAMAEVASRASLEDEAAAAAAFASTMAAYGYPNPYAHLTVFSQHQPVAPPVGWLSATTSRSSSGSAGARRSRNTSGVFSDPSIHHNVAARLTPSPFPGAFPIIPPPSAPSRGGGGGSAGSDESADAKEDREMQELFRMIRTQLTQSVRSTSQRTPIPSDRTAAPPSSVDVSQAERAVLRHVQEDFKKQQQQRQHALGGVAGDSPVPQAPPPPTASTPPNSSLKAAETQAVTPPHRTIFSPQGTQPSPSRQQAEEGDSPSVRSTTAEAVEAAATREEGPSQSSASTPAAPAAAAVTSTLNLEAKPFVPGASSTVPTTGGSTPTKTTFNYKAAPFVPSGAAKAAPATAAAPHRTIRYEAKPFVPGTSTNNHSSGGDASGVAASSLQMNASAPPFVPAHTQTQTQAALASSSSAPRPFHTNHHSNNFPATGMRNTVPGVTPPAADPWASYEMFARWRDMMEAYYQGVFAAQQATAVSSALATPPRYT